MPSTTSPAPSSSTSSQARCTAVMAAGGSGDVLSGLIGGLAAQLPLRDAVPAAVCIHGLAGDLCAGRFGEYSMSKKLAAGADIIVLDVKSGSGSFMKTEEKSRELARELVSVGKLAGRRTVGVITDMDEPLGYAVGNALEVKEAIAVLRGEEKGELLELCLTLGACILTEAGLAENDGAAKALLQSHIDNGSALDKLGDLVEGQGGDRRAVYDISMSRFLSCI